MLTFARLREVNVERCSTWHKGFPNDGKWLGVDWSNAAFGEMGEAANEVKKLRRWDTDTVGALDPSREVILVKLGHEIADTLIYLDLLEAFYGIPARLGTHADLANFDFPNTEGWIGSHWSNAAAGSMGKVCRAVEAMDLPAEHEPRGVLAQAVTITISDIGGLAKFYGVDLSTAITSKFNFISEREGLPHRL